MISAEKLKYLCNHYNLNEKLLLKNYTESLKEIDKIKEKDKEYYNSLGNIFLQSVNELNNEDNNLLIKYLPYSLKNINADDYNKILQISDFLMAYSKVAGELDKINKQNIKKFETNPFKRLENLVKSLNKYFNNGAIDLVETLPKLKNFTLYIKDMSDFCNSFSYRINNHYLIGINSNLSKKQANYLIAKEMFNCYLIQSEKNNLTGTNKTEKTESLSNEFAYNLLLNDEFLTNYIKTFVQKKILHCEDIKNIANFFLVDETILVKKLKQLKITVVTDKINKKYEFLNQLGYKDLAYGEYFNILDVLKLKNLFKESELKKYYKLGGKNRV